MAHFAELDENNVVLRVIVVDNTDVANNGGDEHADGETWCVNFFGGGTWKQTSYNKNFRAQYAAITMKYDSAKDEFVDPE